VNWKIKNKTGNQKLKLSPPVLKPIPGCDTDLELNRITESIGE